MQVTSVSDTLSVTFAALSDPTRRAMLARLSQGEASVNELAAPFKMSLPAVSKHIKVLERAGLLIKTRNAQQRPCKIDGVQLKQAVDWIEQYKQLWEGRLDRLDAYLLELQASEAAAKSAKSVKPAPKPKKSAKSDKKNTTKSIATKAINTPAAAKKGLKKPLKAEKTPKTAKETLKKTAKPKEKKRDDTSSDLQQQIGFDF
jgi:DNA-binding transcriptional ArsR family regulator